MVEKTVDINIIKIVEQYIDIISEKFNVKEVYIFGSCAKGTNNEDSDIDIAVILDSNIDTIDLMIELMILTQNIDLRIEPHPIKIQDFEKGNPFVDEIKNTGLRVT